MSTDALERDLAAMGYHVRTLPSGVVCGVLGQMYTTGLFVGLDHYGYSRRYCYEHRADALVALMLWDGEGDPPGPWIKEKYSERLGPGAKT